MNAVVKGLNVAAKGTAKSATAKSVSGRRHALDAAGAAVASPASGATSGAASGATQSAAGSLRVIAGTGGTSRQQSTSAARAFNNSQKKQLSKSDGNSETGAGLSDKDLDMELVKRVQRGDKSGFDLLVLRYQSKILNLVGRYVHDSHEAQDVAQEAFIKAYRGLANFRGDSAFYTWLYRIAINTAKNHLITASRKISADGPDAQDAEQFDGAHALRDYETPERSALNAEIAGVVEKSINDLPDDLRTALTLREFEGLSYEEIATVMECPIGTVRSRIFRAREAIDNNLNPLLDESSRSLI